jgi:hypothetical protein
MRIRKSGKVNRARNVECVAEVRNIYFVRKTEGGGTTWKMLLQVVDYCECGYEGYTFLSYTLSSS